jgi:hypothetical protein
MIKGIVMSDMSSMFKEKDKKFQDLRGVILWKVTETFN